MAATLAATFGRVDPRLLMADCGPRAGAPTQCGHESHEHCAHGHEQFESFEVAVEPGQTDPAVEALLWTHGALRTKGPVMLDSGPALVQEVGRRIEITPTLSPVSSDRMGRVVVVRRVE